MKKKSVLLAAVAMMGLTAATMAQVPDYVPTQGLVGWWPFNGNAKDESGNGNDGTVNGATLAEDRFGQGGKAYVFDGVNDFISLPKIDIQGNSPRSIFVWVKFSATAKGGCLVSTGEPSAKASFNIVVGKFLGVMGYQNDFYPNTGETIFDNQWHLVGVTFEGNGVLSTYVDGVLDNQTNMTYITKGQENFIGKSSHINYENYFFGVLDDVGIWNRALTLQEIKDLYYGASPYSCAIDSLLNPTINYGSVTDIDGNIYPIVKIGEQEWMADNLRTTRYQNGDSIPNVTDNNEWINLKTGAWSYYNNDSTLNCPYGKLYNWYAASNPNNVCPSGWRLPTFNEIELLISLYLGGIDVAGGKMKSQKIWDSSVANTYNSSGFSGLPGGFRSNNAGGGYFSGLGNQGWWHFDYNDNPSHRNLYIDRESVNGPLLFGFWNLFSKESGVSIRCIKESDPCELIGNIVPLSPIVNIGEQVSFDGQLIVSEGTYFSWQSNTASIGWSDINPSSVAYSGQNSSQLTVKNISLSNHMQEIRLIASNGNCVDTSNISRIKVVDTCIITITDTIFTSVTDTILTTVTDTLLINTTISGVGQPDRVNTIKIFPNPASTHITIDYGNIAILNGYRLRITNSLGQEVFQTAITQPSEYLDLSGWGGNGLYFVYLIDPQGNILDVRKIVLR